MDQVQQLASPVTRFKVDQVGQVDQATRLQVDQDGQATTRIKVDQAG